MTDRRHALEQLYQQMGVPPQEEDADLVLRHAREMVIRRDLIVEALTLLEPIDPASTIDLLLREREAQWADAILRARLRFLRSV